ncbi:MAG: ABC transporter ATP-binding protein [Ignavibacteriaceae bacterium]|nr:ABC transporter ATP-binding protein [Ignavibacteriaceae bacterium]
MLQIKNLVKKFGSFAAVDGISISINKGELYGFLGQNGAGKTTTIKMIAGIYSPTSGTISIDGTDIKKDPVSAKLKIGFVPDQPYLYDKLTGREFMFFSGGLYNLNKKQLQNKIDELVDLLKIENWLDKRTEEYSQGMKQRITIASALLHNPKLIVLDEPMVGLDPQSAVLVKKILKQKVAEGAAVFVSTHSLSFAEEVCSRIGIIKQGKMIYEDDREAIETIKANLNQNFEEVFLELTK